MAVVSWVVEVQFLLVLRTMLTLGVPSFRYAIVQGSKRVFWTLL